MAKSYSSPPKMSIDTNKKYTATFETPRGQIVCDLFAKDAPNTVQNFVGLAEGKKQWKDPQTGRPIRRPYYNNVLFHRVIPNFMIQGGDPEGSGRGGPGYRFEDETKGNPNRHKVGSLSMANAGPNTNGSQFFITHIATDWLDGKHTVFGQVTTGQDVVNKIQQGDQLKAVTIQEG